MFWRGLGEGQAASAGPHRAEKRNVYFPPPREKPTRRTGLELDHYGPSGPDTALFPTFADHQHPVSPGQAHQAAPLCPAALYGTARGPAEIAFSCILFRRSTRTEVRMGPAGVRRCGSPAEGVGTAEPAGASTTSEYFKPTGEPDADYDTLTSSPFLRAEVT